MPTSSRAAPPGLEWLLFDADGVLTNGLLLYTRRGEQVKLFNVRDGLGFRLAQKAGLKVGLLSGRRSRALERRAAELDCDAVILGTHDKRQEFDKFLDDYATAPAKVAYVAGGLMTSTVRQRIPELGLRMALGARRSTVLGWVMWKGLSLTLLGLAAGLLASFGAARLMESLVYGVSPLDPWTYLAVFLVLGAVAALTCFLPARRASAVDPALVLRGE